LLRKALAGLAMVLALAAAVPPGGSPEGFWLTEKKDGIIDIFRCGDALCGKLAWFRMAPNDASNPRGLDVKNPDPAQRDRPLCGLVFMSGFKSVSPDSWEDGRVYDPDNGDTYHAIMRLRADGTLELHGYIGITLFGRSEVWTRYTQPLPACPTR
jgi:uncharacterized protein (DUF2147 family)